MADGEIEVLGEIKLPDATLTEEIVFKEREFRQVKWQQIRDAHRADATRQREVSLRRDAEDVVRQEALVIVDRLHDDGDLEEFRSNLQRWAAGSFSSFAGVNGQMFVNQIVKVATELNDDVLPALLAAAFVVPANEEEARGKIETLVDWVQRVKRGAHPAPARVPFVCSFFWALNDPDSWPCLWPTAEKSMQRLGWLDSSQPKQGDRYLVFRNEVLNLGQSPDEVGLALQWFQDHVVEVGLDPTLVERCELLRATRESLKFQRHFDLKEEAASGGDALRTAVAESTKLATGTHLLDATTTVAGTLLGALKTYGEALADQVAAALGRTVKTVTPSLAGGGVDSLRSDGWVEWRVAEPGAPGCGLGLWVTVGGVYVVLASTHGMGAGSRPNDEHDLVRTLRSMVPTGMEIFRSVNQVPERLLPGGVDDDWKGGYAIGRRFEAEDALDNPAFAREVEAAAADLQPLIDVVVHTLGGRASEREQPHDDELRPKVAEFVAKRGYPTEKDLSHRSDRAEMEAALAEDEILTIDLTQLRSIYNSPRYGGAGPQSALSVTLRDAGPVELETILRKLRDLLWGGGDYADRIDHLLDPEHAVRGLGESVIMKLLAICHPARFIPVFPFSGDMGKAKLMRLIGLDPPGDELSRGRRHVDANDTIRGKLDPYFPNDPRGQSEFLYWLRTREEADADTDLSELAGDLHLKAEFLDEIIELLRGKGQIVFYGPPGTGKTYIARKLAEALAPEPARRTVVQFHPATTYEDFFEGYRPEDIEGQVSYRLTHGPLALLAERAANAPGVDHVLVIDELNRANLPKVLGELLYLLEYREERVRTLYRPEDGFELPSNLLIIGTMNTADRSVGLVDAAMRRRFRFIPFFPNEDALDGLLRRWLNTNNEPVWPAELVDLVNAELVDEFGGPDLQVGHSHFMEPRLDETTVRRIWKYSVHPTIADQLYGNRDRIAYFGFDQVLQRYKDQLGSEELPQTDDPTVSDGALSDDLRPRTTEAIDENASDS